MGIDFEPIDNSNQEFSLEIIDSYFEKYEDPLAVFKSQEEKLTENTSAYYPPKRHRKKPGPGIINEVRTDHSSILAEIEYKLKVNKDEKELIFDKLMKKSKLTDQELTSLKIKLKEIQEEIKKLKRARNVIIKSLVSLNCIAAAMCKKSQRKNFNNSKQNNNKKKQK